MKVELTVKEVAERLGVDEVKIVKEKIVEKKHQFKAGDIVWPTYSRFSTCFSARNCKSKRLIVSVDNELFAIDENGIKISPGNDDNFAGCNYSYIGRLSGFNVK